MNVFFVKFYILLHLVVITEPLLLISFSQIQLEFEGRYMLKYLTQSLEIV